MAARRALLGVTIAVALLAGLVGGIVWIAVGDRSCESMPVDQLQLDGVKYVRSPDTIVVAELGDELGLIDQGLPHTAMRCGEFTLKDGMGTPSVGSKVYAVKGHDPAELVAVVDPFLTDPELFRADTNGALG